MEPKKSNIMSLRLSGELFEQVKSMAEKEERTMASIIRQAIKEWLTVREVAEYMIKERKAKERS